MKRTILLGQDIAQLLFAPLYLFQFWLKLHPHTRTSLSLCGTVEYLVWFGSSLGVLTKTIFWQFIINIGPFGKVTDQVFN